VTGKIGYIRSDSLIVEFIDMAEENLLGQLQELIGGYVETFETRPGVFMWMHGEAMFQDFDRNLLAETIARVESGYGLAQQLKGPAVLTGPPNAEGKTQSLTNADVNRLSGYTL
jgi:hypothetical protein